MSARRFFITDAHDVGELVVIGDADAHKIRDVLRLRAGDEIEIIDSSGALFQARLIDSDGRVTARLDLRLGAPDDAQAFAIDVAQGIPKGAKMDYVVEKLTELGVAAIIPFVSERTIAREPRDTKVDRWRRLAQSAAQQSGRRTIPTVTEPLMFDDVVDRFGGYDVVLFPWEIAAQAPLRDTLPPIVAQTRRALIVIGPEGGFSHDEAERARGAGARVISLGGRILRTETAALVLVSILQYLRA